MSNPGVLPPSRRSHEHHHRHASSFKILEDRGDRVIIEACAIHAGRTLNNTIYPEEELAKAVDTFVTPYRKPGLRHHMMWKDAIGRTLEAKFVGACIHNRPAIVIIAEITDPDAIAKVRDGRYEQISVGSHAEDVYCSICGNNFVTEESIWDHKHWRGEIYDGEVAGWILRGLTFDEWSYVNQPADVNAGNTRVEDLRSGPVGHSASQKESVQKAPDALQEGGNVKGMDREKLQGQLTEAEQTIAQLTEKNERLTKELEALQESVRSLEAQLEEANKRAEELTKSVSELQEANEALVGDLRQALAERLVDYKIGLGQLGMEEREEALEGFVGRSVESLRDSVSDMLAEWKRLAREMPKVDKPGLAAAEQVGVVFVNDSKTAQESAKPDANPFVSLFGGLRSRK